MRAAQLIRHLAIAVCATACASAKPTTTSSPSQPDRTGTSTTTGSKPAGGGRTVRDTTVVADPEMERRVARLELRIMEKDAQIEDLQSRLDDSRAEIVRTLAKVQSSTSRAEAASGVAEAELALRSLQSDGAQSPSVQQIAKIVQQGSAEFDKRNYGGALYLANQAKSLSASYTAARGASGGVKLRTGETAFAIPLHFKVSGRANVRDGPGTTFGIAFSVEAGTILSGVSYLDEWIHVTGDDGRTGWIFRTLVVKP
jgi:uncharacterized coiled-coil protein SlyX